MERFSRAHRQNTVNDGGGGGGQWDSEDEEDSEQLLDEAVKEHLLSTSTKS